MSDRKPRLDKFARIVGLEPAKKVELDTLLIQGTPATEVAEKVQDEWGLYPEVALGSLSRQLQLYNRELQAKVEATREVALRDSTTQRLVVKQVERIDTIQGLNDLIIEQRQRVAKLVETEPAGFLLDRTNKEVRLLLDMYTKLAALQLETGMLRRAPKEYFGHFSMDEESGALDFQIQVETRSEERKALRDMVAIINGTSQVVA